MQDLGDMEDIAQSSFFTKKAPSSPHHYSFSDEEVVRVRQHLLIFYDRDRRMLPWRGDTVDGAVPPPPSAYGTWVSEIMLQQTRVETVISYWHRWMQRFPTVSSLAAASPDEVNAVWAGLGYYRRAQNLLRGAQKVAADFGGSVPSDAKQLLDIPGVGPYTAGAIGSIAFNQPVPLVDGNVIRVFARLRAITLEQGNSAMDKACWALAQALVDPVRPGDFNQALMELGATVCTPKSPNCDKCPVNSLCHARAIVKYNERKGLATDPSDVTYFPRKLEKKKPREIALSVAVVLLVDPSGDARLNRFLFFRRSAEGLLAGQWQFPSATVWEGEGGEAPPEVLSKEELWTPLREYLEEGGLSVALDSAAPTSTTNPSTSTNPTVVAKEELALSSMGQSLDPIVHVFSHQRHTMHVRIYRALSISSSVHGGSARWMTAEEIVAAGITSGCKKILDAVLARGTGPRKVQAKLSFGKAASSSSKRAKVDLKEVIVIDD